MNSALVGASTARSAVSRATSKRRLEPSASSRSAELETQLARREQEQGVSTPVSREKAYLRR
jgi:hypothetical protein